MRRRPIWLTGSGLIILLIVAVFGVNLPAPDDRLRPGNVNGAGLPNTPGSFRTAKSLLYEQVYAGHEQTFYCSCPQRLALAPYLWPAARDLPADITSPPNGAG